MFLRRRVFLFCLMLGSWGGVSTSAVLAQDSLGQNLLQGFQAADQNKDGRVTQKEMQDHRKARFQELDATADGGVTQVEFAAKPPSRLSADALEQWRASRAYQFNSLDQNRDGRLTLAEFSSSSDKAFAMADTNRDGALTRQEINRFLNKFSQEVRKASMHRRMMVIDKSGDQKINLIEFAASRRGGFAEADKNADGSLSLREFNPNASLNPEKAQKEFAAIDRNGDGEITMDEFNIAGEGLFRKIDRNKDGLIDLDELVAVTQ